jgi:epoxide hydrolase 4
MIVPMISLTHVLHDLPNGSRLHAAHWGDPAKPLMLFLHGFPEFHYAWRNLAPRFAEDYFCVAPDLRGFNLSSAPEGASEYKAHKVMADLLLLVQALGKREMVLVSHDWGGAIGWALAIAKPEMVQRLVSINSPHPGAFRRELTQSKAQQDASQYMLYLREPQAAAELAENNFAKLEQFMLAMSPAKAWWTDEVRAAYHACWSRGLQGGLNYYVTTPLVPPSAQQSSALAWQPKPEDLQVKVPTLVIWGEQDAALLPGLLDGLEDWIAELRIERIPGASHWVVHEEPERVAELISEFLTG